MKKILLMLIMIVPMFISAQYYVATDGDDNNIGSIDSPWATFQKAFNSAQPGNTVYIRGGIYRTVGPSVIRPQDNIGYSGTRDNPITYEGYPDDINNGNWPIIDCSYHCDSIVLGYVGDIYNSAISISKAQYLKFKCIEIRNVFQCDSVLTGAVACSATANLTFEQVHVHDIGQRGWWVNSGAWSKYDSAFSISAGANPESATPTFQVPDTTRWINCDTWNLADSLSSVPGNGADGWKVISNHGNYYYWEGCRAWNYTDDGFDPNRGKRVFKNCWAMSGSKYKGSGFLTEGNGFKTSNWQGNLTVPYDTIKANLINTDHLYETYNCLAMFCGSTGFYHGAESDTTDDPRWINNTAYKCGWNFRSRNMNKPLGDVFYNNLSYAPRDLNSAGVPTHIIAHAPYVNINNTWRYTDNYPNFEVAINVTDDDFLTTDSVTIVNMFTAPRNIDGTLPPSPIQLAPGSQLIDAGMVIPFMPNVPYDFNYVGAAPDIGAFEYNTMAGTPPVASFTATPINILEGESVSFDASGSTDSDGTITAYSWNFGNGTGTGVTANRTYSTAGDYTVNLTVTDNDNNSASTNQTITVNAVQVPTGIHDNATLVSAMAIAQPGDTIRLSSDAFTGDIVFSCSGTSVNPVVILPDATFTPVFSGNATVTGDHITLRELTFNGGVELTSFDTDLIYCNINSTLNLNQCTSPTVTNNTFTGTGTVLTFTLPRGITKGRNWIIDYNIYNVGSRARFQGYSYGIYRANYYKFDINSTLNIN